MRSFEQQHAWRSAMLAALINVFGVPLEILVGRSVPGMPLWPALQSMAVGALLATLLLVRRAKATVQFCSIVFFFNTLAIAGGMWVISGYYAAWRPGWIPLQENKLGALIVAILAPGFWPGLLCIACHIGTALARLAIPPRQLPLGEPLATVVFGVVSIVLLFVRLRGLTLQRRTLASASDERLARTFLALRDLANSPLQTIELTSALLRARVPSQTHELDRIDRALTKLRRMNALLTAHDESAGWTPDKEAFEAVAQMTTELERAADKSS